MTEAELERRDRRLRRFAAAVVLDRGRADDALERAYPRALGLDDVRALRLVLHECSPGLRPAARRGSADERGAALDRVLHRLSPRERAVLHLVSAAGLEQIEASAVLGLSAHETVRLSEAAKTRLREALLDEALFGNEIELFDEAVEAHVGYLPPERLERLRPVSDAGPRRAAVAVVGLAVLAAGAAFLAARPVAAAVVDETFSCSAGDGIQMAAGKAFLHLAPAVQLRDAPATLAVGTTGCKLLRGNIPLTSDSHDATHIVGSFAAVCNPEETVILRARITLSHGVASHAEVAMRDKRSGRTIAYVEWSPKRIASWLAADCTAFAE